MYMDVNTPDGFVPARATACPEETAFNQAALMRIIGDHESYLARRHGTRAKLSGARLDGLMMAGRDLSEADLSGASLAGANLRGANLTRASLYCADLSGSDLRGCRLEQADLRGASFRHADLSHAVLDHADVRAATVLYLGGTLKFQGNAHDEAPFGAVDFSGAALCHVSLRQARLDNANFTDALLQGACFRGARLRNACLRNAVVAGVHLDELAVPPQALRHAVMAPTASARQRAGHLLTRLQDHHDWFVSHGKKGRPASVDNEDLRPLADAVKGMCLAGLSARGANMIGVDFSGCQLQAARFDGADCRAARFTGADLSGTSLRKAKLAHAAFKNARICDLILCTGQILYFQADSRQGLMAQFGEALIEPNTLIAALGEQKGSC